MTGIASHNNVRRANGGERASARASVTGIVGREAELAALAAFVDAAAGPRALILSGGPGIGKSTLWQAGVEAARERGMRVLTARPSETETGAAQRSPQRKIARPAP